MAVEQDQVIVSYGMDTTGYEKGAKKVEETSEKMTKKLTDDISEIDSKNSQLDSKEEVISKSRDRRTKSFIGNFGARIKKVTEYYSAYLVLSTGLNLARKATKAFVDETLSTETALRKMNTIMRVSDKALYGYGDSLRDVARQSGLAFEDITSGAYEALSTGIPNDSLIKFSEVSSKFAKAGFTDTVKSTKALTTVMEAYGLETDKAIDIADKFIAAQKEGRFTIDQLSSSLAKVIPVAAGAGVSFQDVAAAFVQLTLDGNTTLQAGTQISRLIKELSDRNSELGKVLKDETTKSFQQLTSEGKDLGYMMQVIGSYMERTNTNADELTESFQSQKGLLSLTKKEGDKYVGTLDNIKESSGELQKTSAEVSKDLNTSFTNLKTELGDLFWNEKIKTALNNLVKGTTDAINKVNTGGKQASFADQITESFSTLSKGDTNAISARGEIFKTLNEIMETQGNAAAKVYTDAIVSGLSRTAALVKVKNIGIGGTFDPNSRQETPAEKQAKIDKENALIAHEKRLKAIRDKYSALVINDSNLTSEKKKELDKSLRVEELKETANFLKGDKDKKVAYNEAIKELDEIALKDKIASNDAKLTEEELFKQNQLIKNNEFKAKLLENGKLTEEERKLQESTFRITQLEDLVEFYSKMEGAERKYNLAKKALSDERLNQLTKSNKKESKSYLEKELTLENIQALGEKSLQGALRNLISTGDARIEALAAAAVEEIAMMALLGENGALIDAYGSFSKGFSYLADPLTAGLAPNAFSQGAASLAEAAAITALAGGAVSALGGHGGGSSSGGSDDREDSLKAPEEVVEDVQEEEKVEVILQGVEPLTKLLEEQWDNKYDFKVRGTKKNRRR